jgi:hypothetical protein
MKPRPIGVVRSRCGFVQDLDQRAPRRRGAGARSRRPHLMMRTLSEFSQLRKFRKSGAATATGRVGQLISNSLAITKHDIPKMRYNASYRRLHVCFYADTRLKTVKARKDLVGYCYASTNHFEPTLFSNVFGHNLPVVRGQAARCGFGFLCVSAET